ncbi:Uncharacterised protein [Pseudomonas fluorescens]|uniref:Uncharacterized protein n=2 Tax=Pseudomonas fluorescens TaxID=294 RepID=A0A3S4R8L2_PSEFL|nr:Uncharacterised protein [Pseudomonas fluorescens]
MLVTGYSATVFVDGWAGVASFKYIYEFGTNDFVAKASYLMPVTVTLPTGKNVIKIYATIKLVDQESGPSNAITLRFLKPSIGRGGTIGTTHTFTGWGLSGSGISLFAVGVDGSPQKPALGAAVTNAERWQITPSTPLLPGKLKVVAIASMDGMEAQSDPVEYLVEPVFAPPVITDPIAGSVLDRSFTLKGRGSVANATLVILKDLGDDTPLGGASTTGDLWEVDVAQLPPGPVSLVAEQILDNGERSGRSVARGFKIRPVALVYVKATRISASSVRFSDLDHFNPALATRIRFSVDNEAFPPPPDAIVNTDNTFETTGAVPFGAFWMTAVQSVPDNAGGWIDSLPYRFFFNFTFNAPTGLGNSARYRPVFIGSGLIGATVRLYDEDKQTRIAPDVLVSSERWSSEAFAEWGPTYRRRVAAKQVFDSVESGWARLDVTIPPYAPVLDNPIEDGQSPQITGTCWPGAVVTLEYNNDGKKHHPIVTNDRWTFRRPEPFESGVTHTFSVFQTVAPQSSAAAKGNFTVRKAMLKPVITVPAEGAEVGRNTLISGTNGMSGATMTVRDAQRGGKLNDKLLLSDGDWSLELENLIHNDYILDAIQTLDGIDSLPSEPRACKVVLLPPVVSVPVEGGDLPRRSTLSGTGWPSAQVTVWLEGRDQPLLLNVQVNHEGKWSGQVSLDQVGQHGLRAQQTLDGEVSRFSQRACRVVPSMPFIESPVRGAAIGSAVVISGFGYPGDTVTVSLASGATLGASEVLEEGTWSLSAHIEPPGGPGALIVVAWRDEYDSATSDPHPLQINTWLPTIDEPAAGRWVGQPVVFAGQGKDGVGQVVSWFNPEVVWAADLPVIDGQWRGEASQSPPPGGNWCRFRQSITADTNPLSGSDWAESERFEVRPPSLGDDISPR